MSRNTRTIKTTPDKVWAVLADGWLYPLWVVGASRMRDVDADWPRSAPGSTTRWASGRCVLDDDTEVLECEPGHRLEVRARSLAGRRGATSSSG